MAQSRKILEEAGKLDVDIRAGTLDGQQSLSASISLSSDEDSGKTFLLASTTPMTVTLPAISDAGAGWNARFLVTSIPTTSNHVVTENTASDTNKMVGSMASGELSSSGLAPTNHSGFTQVNFVNTLIKASDYVDVVCDGASWYVSGRVEDRQGITFT
jgi:hypothetical protein